MSELEKIIPRMKLNPGSNEATDAGCCCPVLDNSHGMGAYGGGVIGDDDELLFWTNESCPLHGSGAKTDWGKIKRDII